MPVFIAALLGGLINIAATLAGRVLIALGFSFVVYQGVDTSLQFLKTQAIAGVLALPPEAVAIASTLKVGVCINIVFSAIMARLLLTSMTGGVIKRMVLK
jgi:hypothetical protein